MDLSYIRIWKHSVFWSSFDILTVIECTCCLTFKSLLHRRHAAIIGFVCCLLAGEGWGNLQSFCPMFVDQLTSVAGLASFIPGILQTICASLTQVIFGHLIDLSTVGKFQLSISGTLLLLSGDTNGWRTALKQAQHHVATV